MADPVTAQPEELREPALPAHGSVALLRRHDFRNLYLAVCASELGDALHYIALMWVALDTGGALGVIAVRLADSVPALVFGLHGGLAADRWNRRRLMVGADLVRAATLVPVSVAALSGHLPIWGLVLAAFVLETATSYFEPAYGALLPALVDRPNVLRANSLVTATSQALGIGGWALAAALLAVFPVSTFFAVNAGSFVLSAVLIARIHRSRAAVQPHLAPRVREGFAALRPLPTLAVGVFVLGIAVTISAGTWIAGVPTLVRDSFHSGAGGFSIVMVGYAAGSITSGVFLARRAIRRKALASLLAWTMYLPAYLLMALGGALWIAVIGAFCAALGQSSAVVLIRSAAQESVPDGVLGRVMGLISLVHRGAHASGLLVVAPLFAVVAPRSVFAGAAIALPLVGLAGAAVALRDRRSTGPIPNPRPPGERDRNF